MFMSHISTSQNLEVQGHVKITELDLDNSASNIVIRLADGTLGRRSVSTLQTKKYQIGDHAHGGFVFWIDETGEHGLVCSVADLHSNLRWSAGSLISTMARGNGPGAGEANTPIIISRQGLGDGSTYAARICNEYFSMDLFNRGDQFNHGDWYLPSRKELSLIEEVYEQLNELALALQFFGAEGFDGFYWSSTEDSSTHSFSVGIGDLSSGEGQSPKGGGEHVRAVRAF